MTDLIDRTGKGSALTAEDHDSNLWRLSGLYNATAHGLTGDGTADDRAALAAADSAAIADGRGLLIEAGVYAIASDITITSAVFFAAGAKLKPASGVVVTFEEGYSATDWQHVFDISAGGKIRAVRMPHGYLTPQHFGARADGSSDDAPALQAACNFSALGSFGCASLEVRLPAAKLGSQYYRVNSTVYVARCIHLKAAVPRHTRYENACSIRGADGIGAVMVFIGAATSTDTSTTEFAPQNPYHTDEWKVYETSTDTGTVDLFVCKLAHTADANSRPGIGAAWETYWTRWEGEGNGSGVGDATLHADAWVTGTAYKLSPGLGLNILDLDGDPSGFTAAGSIVEGVNFRPVTNGNVAFGLVHTTVIHLRHCSANYFGQAGFSALGQTGVGYVPLYNTRVGGLAFTAPVGTGNSPNDFGILWDGTSCTLGNVNQSSYHHCAASGSPTGIGFYVAGNNAGNVEYLNCDAATNNAAGYCDNSNVGCNYFMCHSAQNTWKVEHNGVRYMCIKGHNSSNADSEPGVGADWRRYWAVNGSTLKDTDWATAVEYLPCGGINVCASAIPICTIVGHYSEGGIEMGIVPRGGTQIWGGQWTTGGGGNIPGASSLRVVYHPEFGNAQVISQGGRFLNSFGKIGVTDPWGTPSEAGFWVGTVSSTGTFETDRIYSFGDSRDDAALTYQTVRLAWQNIVKMYAWVRGTATTQPMFGFTGTGFNRGGYTKAGVPIAPEGILVGKLDTNTSVYVQLCAVNAGALAAAETALSGATAVRGQRWYFTTPSAGGGEGVVCTTAGTVGSGAVLKEFGSISA